MLTIACMSLAGGQGKTTTAILLARYLVNEGKSVLCVDCDPQANLTMFLGVEVETTSPTLLEVIKKTVDLSAAIYETTVDKLSVIPSDDGLDGVQDYLSSSGVGALLLKQRLASADFDVCILDAPPQRSQIAKSILGASDQVLVPCEASVKGYGSLTRTIDALAELRDVGATEAELLGVIPFRDRWVGANQTSKSKDAIAAMVDEVGERVMLPTIRESEKYKKAISEGKTLHELGEKDLAYPFEALLKRIGGHLA